MPRHYAIEPTPEHNAFVNELKAALGNSGKDLESDVLLALTAQFAGMLLAQLDQRKYTPSLAMDLITENLVAGNQAALAAMGDPQGRA